jgi:hypothetical protein
MQIDGVGALTVDPRATFEAYQGMTWGWSEGDWSSSLLVASFELL